VDQGERGLAGKISLWVRPTQSAQIEGVNMSRKKEYGAGAELGTPTEVSSVPIAVEDEPAAPQAQYADGTPMPGGAPVGDAPREGNGIPAPIKRRNRKSAAQRSDRSYWVVGRAPHQQNGQRIMVAPTIGQARKRLELVRQMPAYEGHELWVERCVRVS
jgi:hypothetical protein